MSAGERISFAEGLPRIRQAHPDVQFLVITVRKEAVSPAFRAHPNGRYNYMAKLLLLDVMAEHDAVCFIPDARSLKTELKHALQCTELAVRGAMTRPQTTSWESKDCLALQFTDILAGIVWAHHEFGNSVTYQAAGPAIRQKALFFPR
ncbi:hypothetical protein AU476_21580 [Cupriavidus sp. UYMSc13B]|nr:hypothetical protein AU476_21580 [Cupriavidus sp. UYMSc13B]